MILFQVYSSNTKVLFIIFISVYSYVTLKIPNSCLSVLTLFKIRTRSKDFLAEASVHTAYMTVCSRLIFFVFKLLQCRDLCIPVFEQACLCTSHFVFV